MSSVTEVRAGDDAPADPVAAPTEPARPDRPLTLTGWRPEHRLRTWWWTAAITAVAALTRLWALGFPHEKVFDEVYYSTEAGELLRFGFEDNPGYMFIVHPPLGKWAIAIGFYLFGNNSFGWRIVPAIAGILCVTMTTRVAMRMFRSTLLGVVAGALLTIDGISLVMSRVALLDIFLQFFIIAGFAALVVDRDRMRERLGGLYAAGVDLTGGVPGIGPRPWRLAGGVLLGMSCAVKWSALSFWLGFSLLSLLWDLGAFKAAGVARPWRESLRRSWPGGFGSLGVSAVGAYLMCWLGWFVGENSWNRHWADMHSGTGLFGLLPKSIQSLLDYHSNAYQFHSHLYSPHPYKANPWTWLILGRPISFYAPANPTGCGAAKCSREILLIGTPLEYWAFLPALFWILWRWITTRDWRAGAVLMAFVVGWVVWLQNTRRTGFLFYMTPLMPFLVIGLTFALGMLLNRFPNDRDPPALIAAPAPAPAEFADDADLTGSDLSDEQALEPILAGRRRVLSDWIAVRGLSPSYLIRLGLVTFWAGAVIADFIWMWPLFTGGLLTYDQWFSRMWFPGWI